MTSSSASSPGRRKNNCGDDDVLHALLRDELDPDSRDTWADHIESCSACQSRLQSLCSEAVNFSVREIQELPIGWNAERASALVRVLRETQVSAETPKPFRRHVEIPVIDGFQIHEVVGRGGMGAVFRATDMAEDRSVAIKVLLTDTANDNGHAQRFEREIRLAQNCRHPNVVRAFGSGEQNGRLFLVMEFVCGTNLSRLMRHAGQLEISDACEIIRQAALGLQYAHEQGFVHRDLKPSNLMLTTDGVVKLADLGLARSFHADLQHTALTSTDQILGTVDYMAPEQVRAGAAVDARADIYALGATFFKLLTGSAPLETGRHNSLVRKLAALTSEDVADITTVRDDLSPELGDIVNRMLRSNPDDRISSGKDVAVALEPFCVKPRLKELAALVPQEKLNSAPTMNTVERVPTSSGLGSGRWKLWMTVLTVALIAALAAVITIETDQGQIIIECQDPSLQLEIVRNENRLGAWSAGQLAEHTWFWSGNYEVRLPRSASDQFVISNDSFRLSRNDRKVVTISLKPKPTGIAPNSALPISEIQALWEFAAPTVHENQRSVDILTSAEWKWTEAKPFGQAINDGVSINVPVSPSLTPDGLRMMFGRYEAALKWHWLMASRDTLTKEFAIVHELPRTFLVDRKMGLHGPVIVSDSETRGQAGIAANTDLFLHELTAQGEWRESRVFDKVNSVADEECPALSADGLTVVYGRRSEESGKMDLWMATRPSVDAPFEAPHALGSGINGPHRQSSPTLSYDRLALIYQSMAPTENQTFTLWMATRQNVDEPFANPQRVFVGDATQFQLDPALALNGRLLVFRQRTPVVGGLQAMVDNQLYYVERVPDVAAANSRQVAPATGISASRQPLERSTALELQRSWARKLGIDVEQRNSIGMPMRLIPPGEFVMGTSESEIERIVNETDHRAWRQRFRSEGPQQNVQIESPFVLGAFEVTFANYRDVIGMAPGDAMRDQESKNRLSNFPVTHVCWFDAVKFCNELSKLEQLPPFYEIHEESVSTKGGVGPRLTRTLGGLR